MKNYKLRIYHELFHPDWGWELYGNGVYICHDIQFYSTKKSARRGAYRAAARLRIGKHRIEEVEV